LGAIGAKLGRPSSTISRELNRNRVVGSYQPQVACLLVAARSQRTGDFAVDKLAESWNPQQVAGYWRYRSTSNDANGAAPSPISC